MQLWVEVESPTIFQEISCTVSDNEILMIFSENGGLQTRIREQNIKNKTILIHTW